MGGRLAESSYSVAVESKAAATVAANGGLSTSAFKKTAEAIIPTANTSWKVNGTRMYTALNTMTPMTVSNNILLGKGSSWVHCGIYKVLYAIALVTSFTSVIKSGTSSYIRKSWRQHVTDFVLEIMSVQFACEYTWILYAIGDSKMFIGMYNVITGTII